MPRYVFSRKSFHNSFYGSFPDFFGNEMTVKGLNLDPSFFLEIDEKSKMKNPQFIADL